MKFSRQLISVLFLLVLAFYSIAQTKPSAYNKEWNRIDSLIESKGLTKSALTEVKKIHLRAAQEKNDAQLIKALLYEMNLQQDINENSETENIASLEKEIGSAKEPARSMLQNIAAERYWNYLQQHRWQLINRTQTTGNPGNDITSWGVEDFQRKITALYLASIKNENLLQSQKVEVFDPIVLKGNARNLRPTLYDLLANRAIEYFSAEDRFGFTRGGKSDPENKFEIEDPTAFADAQQFASHKFVTTDSSDLQFHAIIFYQKLIRFHLKDQQKDALADADINRIKFINNYGVFDNKNDLYRHALEVANEIYRDVPVGADASYLLAEWYASKARRYNPLNDTANQYAFVAAKKICEETLPRKGESEGKSNCSALLNEINRKYVELNSESVNVPGMPFRVLVTFKNFTRLYYKIISAPMAVKDSLGERYYEDVYWQKLTKLPSIKNFSVSLPDTKDYQQHRAEVKIDSLPIGSYIILASSDSTFRLSNEHALAVAYTDVSNISYINNGDDVFVLNRDNGHPLAGATVNAWKKYYDYSKNRGYRLKEKTYTTDNNGLFHLAQNPSPKNRNDQYLLEITHGNDHLFSNGLVEIYRYDQVEQETYKDSITHERENMHTYLFTDRSIYRPGQTVFFKGIVTTRSFSSNGFKVIFGFKSKVYLSDANGQTIDSLEVTTNDYGSYNGKFRIPPGLLNGSFTISDPTSDGSQNFSVEEYKRPTFYAEFQPVKESYKLNDSVAVTGIVKSFAGNRVNAAKINYRVVREARFPYPWLYSKIGFPRTPSQEIAHGTITADNEGKFIISFNAAADKSIAKESGPVFEFNVTIDATDITGETHNAETSVSVGYKSIRASLGIDNEATLVADSLHKIKIRTENLAGVGQPANFKMVVYSLQSPQRLLRERLWEEPDQFVINKDDYKRDFPHDIYSNENKKENWEKKQVQELNASSDSTLTLNLSKDKLFPGWYLANVTAIGKNGDTVQDRKFFKVVDTLGNAGITAYNWNGDQYLQADPGKQADIRVGSSADNVFVIQSLERLNNQDKKKDSTRNNIEYTYTSLSNQLKTIHYEITQKDLGGLSVSSVFVKHNRWYKSTSTIRVPADDSQLKIAYKTFRDKTEPGSKEKWTITLTGKNSSKVAAEVLTGMYDASLDQFTSHSWAIPSLYDFYYPRSNWASDNFTIGMSQQKYWNERSIQSYQKIYDQLLFSGTRNQVMYKRAMPGAVPAVLQGSVSNIQLEKAEDQSLDFNHTDSAASVETKRQNPTNQLFQVRKDFNETAFFFPELKTDSAGNVEFSFTMPEAVTQWKWMTLAHSKDLAFAYGEKIIQSQKQLMVQAAAPRFLREGDRIDFTGKIVNLSSKELTGQVELQLIDPETNQSVDGWFRNMFPNQYFTAAPGQSVPASFTIEVPFQYAKPVNYRLIVHTDSLSDGEEATLPVVSNRMLVTESIALPVKGGGQKHFTFEKLLQSGNSETLAHHALTIEYTANPAWYVVQALPYLTDMRMKSADQWFERYYANALAAQIVKSSPKIAAVIHKWKLSPDSSINSKLQQNEELKQVLLQETPWVVEALNESQQQKNLSIFFDSVRIQTDLNVSFQNLHALQSPAGGFVWMQDGPEDRYMTQYIITGFARLMHIHAIPSSSEEEVSEMIKNGVKWLDKQLLKDYEREKKNKSQPASAVDPIQVQYLYLRSLLRDVSVPGNIFSAYNYYRKQAQQSWIKQNRYMQGMIALALFKTGDVQTAKNIIASLKQNAIKNPETGMYWKDLSTGGYYWHQAPVEAQALLIEAFSEVVHDNESVEEMKTWLLKNKQTNHWQTSKSTADASYALLIGGNDWLNSTPDVSIKLGDKSITPGTKADEAGTGYFKRTIPGQQVMTSMGDVQVFIKNRDSASSRKPSWGAVYWQYFEDLDKITSSSTPLTLVKKLYIEKNSSKGPILELVKEGDILKTGDKLKARIELTSDRNLEYVHLKDMRASGIEPLEVISGYKWQGGLGYYQSTTDVSTNFYFNELRKGKYVFEYALYITHSGTINNGLATAQCLYAPEFTSHSASMRLNVENAE